jgi:DNA primase
MPGRIPENILETILGRIDIVGIISEYIPLKRAGRNYRATCPFHHEKTPSFMVSPDRQIFHCFGCGAGGNAFGFVMQYEHIEFLEAVEILAKKASVVIPQAKKEDSKAASLVAELYKVNELAANFYEENLNPDARVKDYLAKRGLKSETVKLFKIGWALDKWDGLIAFLRSKGVSLSVMEKAGLVIPKSDGGYYDRFRSRVIFPIFDIKSRIIGFGARVTDNSLPKYMNSPETHLYYKGKNLYGLNLAKEAIVKEDYAVVVEGYLDFITLYQAGFHNIIASSGTALTVDQVRLLKRYTNKVVVVFDGDAAGELATLRSLDIFVEEDMNVKIVALPAGFDPDLYVRKNGIDSFCDKVKAALNLLDYKLSILKKKHNINEIEGKAMISSEILPTINKFNNAIIKSEYLKKLAAELKVGEEAIVEELKKVKDDRVTLAKVDYSQKNPSISPTEKLLIKLMLEESQLLERIRQRLEPADFGDERTSRIVALMFNLMEQGKNIDATSLLTYSQEDGLCRMICESTFLPEVSGLDKEKIVDDCITRIKTKKLHLKKQRLHEEIKIAQESGDEPRLQRLTEEFHNLIKTR